MPGEKTQTLTESGGNVQVNSSGKSYEQDMAKWDALLSEIDNEQCSSTKSKSNVNGIFGDLKEASALVASQGDKIALPSTSE